MHTGPTKTTTLLTAFAITLISIPTQLFAAKAGFAEKDITPKIGMEQPGGYGKAFHKTFHDSCKIRVSVFDDGKKRAAIVGIDALGIPRSLVLEIRKEIEKKCGIPGDAVMIAASHSHSSGPLGMIVPGEFDNDSELVQRLAYEESSMANLEYMETVKQAIFEGVCEADKNKKELMCGFGSGTDQNVAFNRRFRMKNGLTNTHPRQGNPDIVEVAGPVDPEVGVIGAWDKNGKMVGCIVNYACHATTSPGGISANYIYYVEKVIRAVMGKDVVVVFTAGAAGDVTQVNNLSPYSYPQREKWAEMLGGCVGAEAVKVMLMIERSSDYKVDFQSKVLKIKRRPPSEHRLAKAKENVEKGPKKAGSVVYTFAKEIVILEAILKREPVADVEVQAIQVGPTVFLSNPAEYFCQYGLDIKEGSPFPYTYPCSLTNGVVGYVPTEEALSPTGGGYETRLSSYSNLIPTAGTTIANECIKLSKGFTPGKVPRRPPHAPFRSSGWSYGNVPPEVE